MTNELSGESEDDGEEHGKNIELTPLTSLSLACINCMEESFKRMINRASWLSELAYSELADWAA